LKKQQEAEAKKLLKEAEKAQKQQEQQAVVKDVNLEGLTLDESLPEATTVKIRAVPSLLGKRIRVCGYIHHKREQSK
jgi:hypothetical protein